MDNVTAAQGFSALGSESRIEVFQTLVKAGNAGLLVGDIQQRTGIPASTLAHHLKFLSTAQLIVQEKQGRTIINRANFDHLQTLADFILEECCSEAGQLS
jgi:DNA-binding transcriptional ArsR family regulator